MTTVSLGTRAQATAVTILAPCLAMPPASYSRPTMKPVMFCRNSSGIAALVAELDEVGALERRLAEQDAVVGDDADRVAVEWAKPVTSVVPYSRLELVEAAAVDEPGDDLAHVVRHARVGRDDAVELGRVDGRLLGRQHVPRRRLRAGRRVATMSRTMRSASRVVVGEVVGDAGDACACRSPPPRSSAVTTSPVAAFTSGGPPRKIVPWLRTMTASSLIAGT